MISISWTKWLYILQYGHSRLVFQQPTWERFNSMRQKNWKTMINDTFLEARNWPLSFWNEVLSCFQLEARIQSTQRVNRLTAQCLASFLLNCSHTTGQNHVEANDDTPFVALGRCRCYTHWRAETHGTMTHDYHLQLSTVTLAATWNFHSDSDYWLQLAQCLWL